jgi:chromosome segregation ATPase
MNREKQDVDKMRASYDNELSKMRNEQMRLMEKLALAEAKLVSTEKEVELAKSQIQDKEKQMAELKEQLAASKTEFALQLNLFKKEKEEKEALLKKCEMLEQVVRKNMDEINQMRARENANNNDRGSLNSARLNASLQESDEHMRKIEKENKKLQNDVRDLTVKLQRTESQLENMKNLTRRSNSNANLNASYQNDDEGQFMATTHQSPPRSPRKGVNNDNDKLKVNQTKNEHNCYIFKYESIFLDQNGNFFKFSFKNYFTINNQKRTANL